MQFGNPLVIKGQTANFFFYEWAEMKHRFNFHMKSLCNARGDQSGQAANDSDLGFGHL